MLAQLLHKHMIGARVAPHAAASRDAIDTLDVAGIAVVCVSYLDLGENPVRLRGLLRRLRERIPGVTILVGLQPDETADGEDDGLRHQTGADFFVGSLTEAVATCVQLSHGSITNAAA